MRKLLVILILAALVAAVASWLDGDTFRPVGERGGAAANERRRQTDTASTSAAVPAVAAGRASAAADREDPAIADRSQVEQAGLFGVLLDDLGQPIESIGIALLAEGAPERDRRVTCTDARGRFGFPAVHGTFDCSTYNHVSVCQHVTVAHGERVEIELRIEEPVIVLYGLLLRGGRPVTARETWVSGQDRLGEVNHHTQTDDDGFFRHLVRPGSYQLGVSGPPTAVQFGIKGGTVWAETSGAPVALAQLDLAASPRRMRRDLVLPQGSLIVQTNDAHDTSPVEGAFVRVTSVERSTTWLRRTREQGEISFEELPPGDWLIEANSPVHIEPTSQLVTLRASDTERRLHFALQPAGTVLVELRHDGELFEPDDVSQLWLQLAGGERLQGARVQGALWRYAGTRFEQVPIGTHELRCEDAVEADGSIVFAPIAPIAPQAVTVVAGDNTFAVEVTPRPRLTVMVRMAGNRVIARVAVSCPTGSVRSTTAGPESWAARVPPGDYQVSIETDTGTRTERVSVFAEDVDHVVELGARGG